MVDEHRRVGRRCDRGGDPGPEARGDRVRRHRGRRRRQDPRLPREGRRPADDAGQRPDVSRQHGQLRVRHPDADRRRHAAREPVHRPRQPRDPGAHLGRGRPGLRLLEERRPGPGRPREGVLARRRDARFVLPRQHGPDRPGAGLQPVQRTVAGVHLTPGASAGQGVTRSRRRAVVRRRQPAVSGFDHLGLARRALDRRARRRTSTTTPTSPTRSSSPTSASAPACGCTAASSTRTSSSPTGHGSASNSTPTASGSPSATKASS